MPVLINHTSLDVFHSPESLFFLSDESSQVFDDSNELTELFLQLRMVGSIGWGRSCSVQRDQVIMGLVQLANYGANVRLLSSRLV